MEPETQRCTGKKKSQSSLKGMGSYMASLTHACTYQHPERKLKTLVHGNDFVTVGTRSSVKAFNELLRRCFTIKTVVVGDGKDEDEVHGARILNRIVRWTTDGFEMEADQRHAELVVESLALSSAKGIATPGFAQAGTRSEEEEREDERPLEGDDATLFRSVAARANYFAQDRVDIMFATKEICRHMATPAERAMKALKRLARYLIFRPRLVLHYRWPQTSLRVQHGMSGGTEKAV